jgi:hypothetical protein
VAIESGQCAPEGAQRTRVGRIKPRRRTGKVRQTPAAKTSSALLLPLPAMPGQMLGEKERGCRSALTAVSARLGRRRDFSPPRMALNEDWKRFYALAARLKSSVHHNCVFFRRPNRPLSLR